MVKHIEWQECLEGCLARKSLGQLPILSQAALRLERRRSLGHQAHMQHNRAMDMRHSLLMVHSLAMDMEVSLLMVGVSQA